jgi:hypothetical protein
MTTNSSFPPAAVPGDKAKYRQFLIDHELDPNLNADDLRRALQQKSEAERAQLQAHWRELYASFG